MVHSFFFLVLAIVLENEQRGCKLQKLRSAELVQPHICSKCTNENVTAETPKRTDTDPLRLRSSKILAVPSQIVPLFPVADQHVSCFSFRFRLSGTQQAKDGGIVR